MTEAWMLADISLLISEIGTDKNNIVLNLPSNTSSVESISDPKNRIINAINIALSEQTSRRRKSLKIAELYSPISQKLSLKELNNLNSYKSFRNNCIEILRKLGYIN